MNKRRVDCGRCPDSSYCLVRDDPNFQTHAITKAMKDNDIDTMSNYLGVMGIHEDSFDLERRNVCTINSMLLDAAWDLTTGGTTNEETATALLKLATPAVDLVLFSPLLLMSLPKERLSALPMPPNKLIRFVTDKKNDVSDFRKHLFALSEDEYLAFIKYLSSTELGCFDRSFNTPVLDYARLHDLATLPEMLTWVSSLTRVDMLDHESEYFGNIVREYTYRFGELDDPDCDYDDEG